jgi:hypothetical protein
MEMTKIKAGWMATIYSATTTRTNYQMSLQLSTSRITMYGDSIADKPSEPQDESLTTRTSTLATMMVDWIVLEATAQQKSKRCRSKRIYHANMNRCTF